MPKKLINEAPLLVLPTLAAALGNDRAMMLQQVHWLTTDTNKVLHNGVYWIPLSGSQIHAMCPGAAPRTAERHFKWLKDKRLIQSVPLPRDYVPQIGALYKVSQYGYEVVENLRTGKPVKLS